MEAASMGCGGGGRSRDAGELSNHGSEIRGVGSDNGGGSPA